MLPAVKHQALRMDAAGSLEAQSMRRRRVESELWKNLALNWIMEFNYGLSYGLSHS